MKGPVAVLWAALRPTWCDETGWNGGLEAAYDLNAIEERDWMDIYFFPWEENIRLIVMVWIISRVLKWP